MPSIKPIIDVTSEPMPQVKNVPSSMMRPCVLYPRINLWIPKAPKRIPQMPAAIFLLASLEFICHAIATPR